MTPAQWRLLTEFAAATYGELHLRGPRLRSVKGLEARGLVEPVGYGMRGYKITAEGRRQAELGF